MKLTERGSASLNSTVYLSRALISLTALNSGVRGLEPGSPLPQFSATSRVALGAKFSGSPIEVEFRGSAAVGLRNKLVRQIEDRLWGMRAPLARHREVLRQMRRDSD